MLKTLLVSLAGVVGGLLGGAAVFFLLCLLLFPLDGGFLTPLFALFVAPFAGAFTAMTAGSWLGKYLDGGASHQHDEYNRR